MFDPKTYDLDQIFFCYLIRCEGMLKIILTGLMYLIPIFDINLKEEYSNTMIKNVLHQLESTFIGLCPVKKRIKEIAALLLIQRLRKKFTLKSTSS